MFNSYDNNLDNYNEENITSEISIFASDKENFLEIEEITEINNSNTPTAHKNRVKILKINHSELKNLKGIQDFINLSYLNLSSNRINSIALFFKNMRHLKVLNLSCNCLITANGIEYLYNLEELDLSHNKINNLDVFQLVIYYII